MFLAPLTRRLYGLWLVFLATAGCCLLGSGPVSASTVYWSAGRSADLNKDIVIYADQIAAWQEQKDAVFLLTGKVWIGQGLVNVRFAQGIIFVRQASAATGGYTQLRIYAEGNASTEEAAKEFRSDRALVELKTRSSLRFKAANGRIFPQSYQNDPLYKRARRELSSVSHLPETPQRINDDAAGNLLPSPPVGNALPPAKLPNALKAPVASRSANAVSARSALQLTGGQMPQTPGEPLPPPTVVQQPAPQPSPGGMPGLPPFLGGSAAAADRQIIIRPRSSFLGIQARNFALPTKETAVVISSGVILTVLNADGKGGMLDIEADRLVFWTRGSPQQILNDLQANRNQKDRPMEFYLSGHVEIRTQSAGETRLLRADEVYYDVNRHVAVATHADLEIDDPRLLNPIHVQSEEILQLNSNLFQAKKTLLSASALPWDPGLSVTVQDTTLETKQVYRRNIFGRKVIDLKTGQPIHETQRYFRGKNALVWMEDVPVFYLPYMQGDVNDPLGPLENVGFNFSRIFGFQLYTTWDVYDLIGITKVPGTRWRLDADYLSRRGPALGSDFTYGGENLFDMPNRYKGFMKAYGIYDTGPDILGGNRGQSINISPTTAVPVTHPTLRSRFLWKNMMQDLPYGFVEKHQIALLSDKNYLQQFFAPEWYNGLNQDTYFYLKQQQGNLAWDGLLQTRTRGWITKTRWWPKLNGYLLGMSLFDNLVTYNLKSSAGYAQLRTTDVPAFAYVPTDVNVNTGRFDLWQEASIPFYLGPVRLAPYGIVDLTYYSQNVLGNSVGRFYGAGGVRGSMPLSRLYAGVDNDFFNLNGLYHKINLVGNYYIAHSNVPYSQLPQLDRLNDDASDQAIRDIHPVLPNFYPTTANSLASPLFDPQVYAIRQMVLNRIDTRNSINVLQLGVNQRWQTKRGFAGRQHIIDWMTLNMSGSVFPNANRDNFGQTLAFLKYNWTWYIGDRTSLVSTGWVDPISNGPRVFTFGANTSRTDASNLYLGYRQIDPLKSKALIGSLSYRFSRKYAMSVTANYDFGIKNESTTVLLTRYGKDMRVSFGVTYSSILNNFGVIFSIMPNLFPKQLGSPGGVGSMMSGSQVSR